MMGKLCYVSWELLFSYPTLRDGSPLDNSLCSASSSAVIQECFDENRILEKINKKS